jgi:hypothetical protein
MAFIDKPPLPFYYRFRFFSLKSYAKIFRAKRFGPPLSLAPGVAVIFGIFTGFLTAQCKAVINTLIS